jgi:hypothetical protein
MPQRSLPLLARRAGRVLAMATGLSLLAATLAAAAPPLIRTPLHTGPSFVDTCARIYSAPDWRPATLRNVIPVPKDERPPKGLPILDAAHRTCVVRVTDHAAELGSGFARNEYSRRQSFNADNTRLLVISQDGYWHLYSATDLQYLGKLPGLAGDAEPQWHPTRPNIVTYLPLNGIGMTMHELDVETGHTRVIADLSIRIRALWPTAQSMWTRSEGSPSQDQRYWAFQVDDAKWAGLGLVSYDLKNDRIIATYDLARNKKVRPDHLSMSPSGNHIVVSWLDGVTSFRNDFTNPQVIHKKSEHSDIAIDKAGDDVFVAVDYEASGAPVFSVNLRTGKRTNHLKTYLEGTATAMHFSGKAYARPGWVLVSTYADYGKAGPQWLHRKVFAMSLDPEPRIINLAHHHSHHAEYFTEPQASTNRDMTRVLFSSNWGTQSKTDIDTFMVVVPEKAFSPAP